MTRRRATTRGGALRSRWRALGGGDDERGGAEALYRGLVEAAPDAIVGVTEDGRIVLVNAQTEALFGYGRDELIGRPVETLVPGAARGGQARGPVRAALEGEDLAGRRKDGSEFPAEISLSSIETPGGLLVSAAIRDGTERRQAAIIASSSDAIISTDLTGAITSWNLGAETLHGHTSATMLGTDLRAVCPPEDRKHMGALLGSVVAEARSIERESRRLRADGTVVEVAEFISPLYDPDGSVVGISNIARDITERKRIEMERLSLEERLRQSERLESLGQLAGGVAHDFNNLLAVILNYATFVAEEITDNPAALEDVEEIRAAAQRGVRLTHQLLIFARREIRTPEVLDIDEVVADVQRLLSRTLGEHIELRVKRSAEPLRVSGDRGQLEQVLLNLAVNARDAMPDGGRLTIETSAVSVEDDVATIAPGLVPGPYVQVSVSDTGSGMSAATVDRAFEPFFSTKPKGEGTGLGLATVYGIVTDAGGSVLIFSEPDLGTTIRAYLPRTEGPVTVAEGPVEPPAPPGSGERVLIVEDEAAIRRVAGRILERNGYEVISAPNGPTAVELARRAPFDVLLTDAVMPQMSGRDLQSALQEQGLEFQTLFMSGYSEGVLGPSRHLDDDVDLIQKPFTERQLVARIHRSLHGS